MFSGQITQKFKIFKGYTYSNTQTDRCDQKYYYPHMWAVKTPFSGTCICPVKTHQIKLIHTRYNNAYLSQWTESQQPRVTTLELLLHSFHA